MGTPDIVLCRIDNRLIHGQVATQWTGSINANLILVANDEVAGNKLRQGLMDMAAPSYAQTRYWTIQKTIDTIGKASPKQHIFLVCETPEDVLKLVEGGVRLQSMMRMSLHSVSFRNLVLNWRSVVFRRNLRRISISCSSNFGQSSLYSFKLRRKGGLINAGRFIGDCNIHLRN